MRQHAKLIYHIDFRFWSKFVCVSCFDRVHKINETKGDNKSQSVINFEI